VITAFQHSTARGKAFASLLLVARQDGELVYRGKVGTGFDAATEANLAARFTPLSRKTPTFSGFPDLRAKITWLDPRLIAEVHYA
jgi:bifunctional non-homologous end joining protein LigD